MRYSSVHSSNQVSSNIHPFIRVSSSIHPFIPPYIQVSSSIHSSIQASSNIHSFILSSIHSSLQPSIHPSIQVSPKHPPIHPSVVSHHLPCPCGSQCGELHREQVTWPLNKPFHRSEYLYLPSRKLKSADVVTPIPIMVPVPRLFAGN